MGLTYETIKIVAQAYFVEPAAIKAFIDVETPGRGFDNRTGKLLIQFEPVWFRRLAPYAPSGKWSVNKVDVQSKEWIAFNHAFNIDADAAMQATSIGLGQIMGFHYKLLEYDHVGQMWDDAKKSEVHQLGQLCAFLTKYKNGRILKALEERDYHTAASLYNGQNYKQLAQKYGREPYDISLMKAHDKALNIF